MTEFRRTGIHHVAYACRDIEATKHFYEDLMGMPLVHTEVKHEGDSYFRHLFFDTGDGSCIAFFQVSGMGESSNYSTQVSTGNGLPVWVNHVAFGADEERTESVRQRMTEDGIVPFMEVDHGWCVSLYYIDPNGIMVEMCRDTTGFAIDPELATERMTTTENTDHSTFLTPMDVEGLRGFDLLPTDGES